MKREYLIGEIVTSDMIIDETGISEYENETLIQGQEVADIVGRIGLYETFARADVYHPFTYIGQCAQGDDVNRQAEVAECCYICSPFRTDDKELQEIYIGVARQACRDAVADGMVPIAPHLYFPGFLDEAVPELRDFGLSAGTRALKGCERMRVYVIDGRYSDGMQAEIWHAIYQNRLEPEYIKMDLETAKRYAGIHTEEG